jgi:putative ABC transport system permease protein
MPDPSTPPNVPSLRAGPSTPANDPSLRADFAAEVRARLSSLRLSPAREAEIVEELSQHLDDRRQELIAGGTDPDVATHLTRAELSDRLTRYLAALRQSQSSETAPLGAAHPGRWRLEGWQADVRDAWRAIRHTPLQTATIVVSLTIGSTLTVLMFGVVNAMLGGSMPGVRDRDRLVRLGVERAAEKHSSGFTMGEFRRFPASVPGLESFGGELSWRFSASINGRAVATDGMFVSGAYFSVLGTGAALGRLIEPADDGPGAAPVVVIGHEIWQRQFGGDLGAIGTSIRIGTGTYQVVGVLPALFVGIDSGDFGETVDERSQLWLPMSQMWVYPDYRAARVDRAVGPRMIGRLAHGMSPRSAEAQAQGIVTAVGQADSAGFMPVRARLVPFLLLPMSRPLQITAFITVLMGVPFIVLGIACANVAGIQLARAVGRTHEISIRMSLGASRLRVARTVAVETGLMALIAGVLAWAIASQTLRLAGNVLPFAVVADARVFLFAMLLPLGIALAAGFAPAWRATGVNVLSGLRLGPRVGRTASRRLRRVVVIGQVALSVLLLVVASLLIRSIASLGSSIGPLQDGVLVAYVGFSDLEFDANRSRQLRSTVAEEVSRLPGVAQVAVSTSSGLFRGGAGVCWGDPRSEDMWKATTAVAVTPAFFRTLGLTVRRGRALTDADREGVVVVNEAFMAQLLNGAGGVGSIVKVRREYGSRSSHLADIVGVVEDSYERVPRGAARPRCYVAMDPGWAGDFTIFARADAASALAPSVQRILFDIDPRLSAREIGTVSALVRERYRWLYWITDGLSVVSLIALVLSAVGLFALMSYSVSQRTNEFGIRLALGAVPRNITSGVLRESLALTLTGTALGLVAAIPVASVLNDAILSSISLRDPVPTATVAILLVVVGVIATLGPAWRVSRIDPVWALRQE